MRQNDDVAVTHNIGATSVFLSPQLSHILPLAKLCCTFLLPACPQLSQSLSPPPVLMLRGMHGWLMQVLLSHLLWPTLIKAACIPFLVVPPLQSLPLSSVLPSPGPIVPLVRLMLPQPKPMVLLSAAIPLRPMLFYPPEPKAALLFLYTYAVLLCRLRSSCSRRRSCMQCLPQPPSQQQERSSHYDLSIVESFSNSLRYP